MLSELSRWAHYFTLIPLKRFKLDWLILAEGSRLRAGKWCIIWDNLPRWFVWNLAVRGLVSIFVWMSWILSIIISFKLVSDYFCLYVALIFLGFSTAKHLPFDLPCVAPRIFSPIKIEWNEQRAIINYLYIMKWYQH